MRVAAVALPVPTGRLSGMVRGPWSVAIASERPAIDPHPAVAATRTANVAVADAPAPIVPSVALPAGTVTPPVVALSVAWTPVSGVVPGLTIGTCRTVSCSSAAEVTSGAPAATTGGVSKAAVACVALALVVDAL